MKTSHSFWRALLLLICLLVAGRTRATTFETVQSSYLGDGWFQYDVKMFVDPYFLEQDLVQFAIIMTNGVDVQSAAVPPVNWKNDTNGGSWIYTGPTPQSRPREQVFLMHSSATNYMLGTNAISLLSLVTSDIFPPGIISGNMVGYATVPCLLPCPPAMADGSPTNHVESFELMQDPVIKKLMVGPSVYGLAFDWASDSTELLQASPDLMHWTNITYLYGTSGTTVWTTNQHFLDHGQYFRLVLAAGFQTTNVPPLSETPSLRPAPALRTSSASSSTPRVTSCMPKDGVVSVELATTVGQNGEVRMINSHGVILQTQSFKATGDSVVVNFTATVSGAVFFQAVADQ